MSTRVKVPPILSTAGRRPTRLTAFPSAAQRVTERDLAETNRLFPKRVPRDKSTAAPASQKMPPKTTRRQDSVFLMTINGHTLLMKRLEPHTAKLLIKMELAPSTPPVPMRTLTPRTVLRHKGRMPHRPIHVGDCSPNI